MFQKGNPQQRAHQNIWSANQYYDVAALGKSKILSSMQVSLKKKKASFLFDQYTRCI